MPRARKFPKSALAYFVEKGRKGGKRSAPARMKKLTPEKRSEVARKAARARWDKLKAKASA